MEVVGVAGHVRHYGLREEGRGQLYLPSTSMVWALSVVVRTAADPLAVAAPMRDILTELDPGIPLTDVRPMEDLLGRQTAEERLLVGGLGALGIVAAGLSLLGLYGVLSYGVLARRRELGIRMALGAPRARVVRGVVGEGVLLGVVGIAAGLLGSLGLGRALEAALFGVGTVDTVTIVVVAVGFTGMAALASLLPARRITSIDPAGALRAEG
jgi:ABC-type antimicrobial peptide transport system permease subunit